MQTSVNLRHAFDRYVSARQIVVASGYERELDWQASRNIGAVTESDFLREAAWVILNSGMRESVVRKRFPGIEEAFLGFKSAELIVGNRHCCFERAQAVFNHHKKILAILGVAFRINLDGFANVKASTVRYGTAYLASFDFIGPVTSMHLAKNLGLSESKADRHLVRVATSLGFKSVSSLCSTLSELSGDSVPVVDIVLWRFATLKSDYKKWLEKGESADMRAFSPACRLVE